MELNHKEELVRKALENLLTQHSLTEAISAIDEIVLNYVLGVLECLDCEDVSQEEDVEPFAETMEAYLPGFVVVAMTEVGNWMMSTLKVISQHQDSDGKLPSHTPEPSFLQNGSTLTTKTSQSHNRHSTQTRSHQRRRSSSEDDSGACGDKRVVIVQCVDSDSIAVLRELCPAASGVELQHCLHMSGGDVEEAACLLLFRQESGTAITVKTESRPRKKYSANGSCPHNDESLKDSILAKYSFVDTSEDKTEHRPELFTKEQKKLIRYREGQVVSTKGERFSEIKKQEADEMKKTYVNLKPQRKYRFH
ncbi:CUE domain-containing protein 2-A-like [Littorina saxatilis]|uniref:CUE domain-containing protein 2 n=1 Tax=Littorina saxatilis TaxID=31220 RepID=A0AAN9GGN3_9CAEN